MFNLFFATSVFLGLGIFLGRAFGKWQVKHDASHKLRVVNVAEGALFALLGLLVAFTFTGAYERFEARKAYIIDEANAIDTAYLRINLLATGTQAGLRESLRQYLASRLVISKSESEKNLSPAEIKNADDINNKIWDQAIAACNLTGSSAATELFIASINNMFEIANKRIGVARIHPPIVIFYLLIGLAMLSAFLAGYTTAKSRVSHSIHTLSYVAITAFTIYIIIDLEFPRIGMIRVDKFDQVLAEVRNHMN